MIFTVRERLWKYLSRRDRARVYSMLGELSVTDQELFNPTIRAAGGGGRKFENLLYSRWWRLTSAMSCAF